MIRKKRVRESEKGKWDKVGRTKGEKREGDSQKWTKIPSFSGEKSFVFLNIKDTRNIKKQKGFWTNWDGPKFYISNLCYPLIVVVFSPEVLSFSWLYVSFCSHFHLYFSSLFFFLFFVVLIHVVHFLCIHISCSLPLYLLSFFWIVFLLHPLLVLPLPRFSFSPDCCLSTLPTLKQKHKNLICSYWQNWAGFSEFH